MSVSECVCVRVHVVSVSVSMCVCVCVHVRACVHTQMYRLLIIIIMDQYIA